MRSYFHMSVILLLTVPLYSDWTSAEESTRTVIHNTFLRDFVTLIDGEFHRLFKNADTRTTGINGISLRLVQFDFRKLANLLYSRTFWGLQYFLPKQTAGTLSSVINKLENDTSIIEEIAELLDNQGIRSDWFVRNIKHLDADVRLAALKNQFRRKKDKIEKSDLEKFYDTVININWESHVAMIKPSLYAGLQKSLSLEGKKYLRSFLDNLEAGQPLDMRYVEYAITEAMSKLHTSIQHLAATAFLPIEEKSETEIHEELQLFGVYKTVEQSLRHAKFSLRNIKDLPDVEKLIEIILEVNCMEISQKLSRYVFYLATSDMAEVLKLLLRESRIHASKQLQQQLMLVEYLETLLEEQAKLKTKLKAKRRTKRAEQADVQMDGNAEQLLGRLERDIFRMLQNQYDDAVADAAKGTIEKPTSNGTKISDEL